MFWIWPSVGLARSFWFTGSAVDWQLEWKPLLHVTVAQLHCRLYYALFSAQRGAKSQGQFTELSIGPQMFLGGVRDRHPYKWVRRYTASGAVLSRSTAGVLMPMDGAWSNNSGWSVRSGQALTAGGVYCFLTSLSLSLSPSAWAFHERWERLPTARLCLTSVDLVVCVFWLSVQFGRSSGFQSELSIDQFIYVGGIRGAHNYLWVVISDWRLLLFVAVGTSRDDNQLLLQH